VSLPADQFEQPAEELDKVDDSASRSDECHPNKTLLLVYRIIYYSTFDGFTFPSESNSALVDAGVSQPTLDNQVNTAWQARYSCFYHARVVQSSDVFSVWYYKSSRTKVIWQKETSLDGGVVSCKRNLVNIIIIFARWQHSL